MFDALKRIIPWHYTEEENKILQALRDNPMKTRRVVGRSLIVDPEEVRQTKEFQNHLKIMGKHVRANQECKSDSDEVAESKQ